MAALMRWLVVGCIGAVGMGCSATPVDKIAARESGIEGEVADSGAEPRDSGAPEPRILDWQVCEEALRLEEGALGLDDDVRCASHTVPFRRFSTAGAEPTDDEADDEADDDSESWTEPEELSLLVFELPALAPPQGTFWLLDGGPGGTGLLPARSSELVQELREDGFAVRVPMHRGSTELAHRSCNGRSLAACGKDLVETYGDGLTGFGPMEAAADVLAWLDADDREGPDVLWGQSYGSLVAQLVLAQRPDAVQGVVLDGVLPLDAEVEQSNILADAPFRAFLESCREAPRCEAETGGDPIGLAERAVAAGCGPLRGVSRDDVEALVRGFAGSAFAPVTLPMLAMMDRCETADREALTAMITFATASVPRSDELNPALQAHVLVGELFRPTLTVDELIAQEADLLFRGTSLRNLYSASEAWEGIEAVALPESLGTWDAPVLVLQGGHDLQTPALWSERVVARLDAPRVTSVALPSVGHLALAGASTAAERTCVTRVLASFAESADGVVDEGCVSVLPPLDHDAESEDVRALSELVFGVSDPWSP